jgi:hypothetical protein
MRSTASPVAATPAAWSSSMSSASRNGLPPGLRLAGAHQPGVGLRAQGPGQDRRRPALAQRGRQDRGRRVVGDRAQQRLVDVGLARAHGRHEDERQLLDPPAEVLQCAQRRRVGPLEVVDRQQQRRLRGAVGHQPVERVDDVELVLRQGGRVGAAQPDDARRQARRALEHRRAVVRVQGGQVALEQLAHDAEREALLEHRGAGDQRRQPMVGRGGDRGLQDPRLADAGDALDDDHGSAPARRAGERPAQGCQLRLALHERRR